MAEMSIFIIFQCRLPCMEYDVPCELTSEAVGEFKMLDPEDIVALEEKQPIETERPSTEHFETFVDDVDIEPVAADQSEDVPIEASMDELFAEQ